MTLRKSTQAALRAQPYSADDAGSVIAIVGEHTVVAGQFALNDTVEMLCLPAGCIPVGARIVTDQVDSNGAPTLSLDIGLMSGSWLDPDGAGRTVGQELAAGNTTARAGGVADLNTKTFLQLAASNVDRSIGLKVAAAAATLVAGAKIRLIVNAMPVPVGIASGS